MTPLLRTPALGLACIAAAVTAFVVPTPADRSPASAAAANAAAHADPPPHTGEADVIRERIGHDGTRYFEEEWHDPGTSDDDGATDATDAAVAALHSATAEAGADAFALHSKPGASRKIFLDFDGGSLLSTNSWLLNGLATTLFPGWSLDSSGAFSDSERAVITEVWARVAEDYAPFDIDVTTEEPPAGGLWRGSSSDTAYGTRVAFSSGSAVQSAICSGPCGGIAWVNVFNSITNGEIRGPAWVFPSSLGNRAKTMAEAAAHEAGHTLGLGHDGAGSSSYYSGNSLWGPIMGSPYNSAITQWSKGDYPGANNTEDDLAKIVAGGAPLRADEAGATPQTAYPLTMLPDQQGYLTSRNDVDWFSVNECGGTVTVRADPAAIGPNVDLGVEVRAADGSLIAAAAPNTTKTTNGVAGLGAQVQVPLSGGPFYVAVYGTGSGAAWAAGGYDNYGSVGSYRVYAGGCAGSPPPPIPTDTGGDGDSSSRVNRPGRPSTPKVVSGKRGGATTIGVRWRQPAAGGGTINGYLVTAYKLDGRGRIIGKASSGVLSPDTRRASLRLSAGRWTVKVKAANEAGWSTASRRSGVVRSR